MIIHKEIYLHREKTAPLTTHLSAMGGSSPGGDRYGVNSRYLTRNGFPWIPVMGEFHFSRVPRNVWRRELEKMKSLGVTLVSSYVFWLHHGEIRGEWDWGGNGDLRGFTGLIGELGMKLWLRIGPWPHGEARNGGFPDWLMEEGRQGMALRSDDPAYLSRVREFYGEIGKQIGPGGDIRRGGPLIGIQIENEYGHCGGPGTDDHIRTLRRIAREEGIDAPFISVTGWGGANIPRDEVLPVMGGYPAHPWTQHTSPLGPMGEYLFMPLADDPRIGGDLAGKPQQQERSISWDPSRTPYLTCELGGGIQVTGHRRPWLSHDDISALTLCKLGSGMNMPGYYMFHGGTNPVGRGGYTQESRESGSPNDVPRLSYDFQAMIGEYGRIRRSALRNKLFHYFLRDFGDQLAPLEPLFPESSPTDPEDRENLRWSLRTEGTGGFLFINNHSRHQELPTREVEFLLRSSPGDLTFPPLLIKPHTYGFLPFRMTLPSPGGDILLNRATVQPVCRIPSEGSDIFFFHNFTGEPGFLEITLPGEETATLLTFPAGGREMALSDGTIIRVLSREEGENFWSGETKGSLKGFLSPDPLLFTEEGVYALTERPLPFTPDWRMINEGTYEIDLEGIAPVLAEREEVYLTLDLVCDRGELLLNGKLVGDLFYYGAPWEIGLKDLRSSCGTGVPLVVRLHPPNRGESVYFDCPPPDRAELIKISLSEVERVPISP